MFDRQIEAALAKGNPTAEPAWLELEQMAASSPETTVELVCAMAVKPLAPEQRGWLAIGPLRSAIAAANPTEEQTLEERAGADPMLALLLEALVRYEKKQQIVVELLEGTNPAEITPNAPDQQVIIPNVHEEVASQSLDEEAWSKIVRTIQAAPENQLFMLASTIVEPLLLRNESVFRKPLLEQIRDDERFRKALSYCDLSFSEPFLDEITAQYRRT